MALVQSTGKLTFLRVHDVGTKFGPRRTRSTLRSS